MNFEEKLNKSRAMWDDCADIYENQIVAGHPDIVALEEFEEDFLDAMLRYLIDNKQYPIKLMDIGCGSGRLHLRYLLKTSQKFANSTSSGFIENINLLKNLSNLKYDPIIAKGLEEVWGIDYSLRMLDLAKAKSKLKSYISDPIELSFVHGSAFELKPESQSRIPISVSLINTIGIMQDPKLLMKAMRRQVGNAAGIACIFCYKKSAIESYGLGNYESTLDVSGQPDWLIPTKYSHDGYKMVAHNYKLAHSGDTELIVDVHDTEMKIVENDFVLKRDPALVEQTINSGHIKTFSGYESHWYSFERMDKWIKELWSEGGTTYHLDAKECDSIRAEPEQIAIFDPADRLKGFCNT